RGGDRSGRTEYGRRDRTDERYSYQRERESLHVSSSLTGRLFPKKSRRGPQAYSSPRHESTGPTRAIPRGAGAPAERLGRKAKGDKHGVRARLAGLLVALFGLVAAVLVAGSVRAPAAPQPAKEAVAVGTGGAVASVDPDATRAGIQILREGG